MSAEASSTFPCFGSHCAVWATGAGDRGTAAGAVALAERSLRSWHERFTRFDAASELSAFNADPRDAVPASPLMLRLTQVVRDAARRTGGLVDATLLGELEAAGYRADLGRPLPLAVALGLAPPRRPAGPSPVSRWGEIAVDADAGVVRRPPGLRIDSGGIAKGMFADVLAELLAPCDAFAVDCAGDVRVGGAAGIARPVRVTSPFDGGVLHEWALADAGVATSGIGRRSWLDERGRVAHHLLDPATGRPAYTGVVQATAIAATATEAEERAKLAVLRGPERAAAALPDGGLVVYDDGSHDIVAPRTAARSVTIPACAAPSSSPPSWA
ncbi:MAG: FAD:protein FMN transferase [Solirubrobacteraceae bacterium]